LDNWQEIEFDLKNVLVSFLRHYRVLLDVEDVMQDVWMVCREKYDPERGELLPFAIMVGKHIIIDAKKVQGTAKKHQEELFLQERPDVLTVQDLGKEKRIVVGRSTLEAKALQPLMAQEEWDSYWAEKWELIQVMMRGQSSKAQVLWVMYTHLVEYDALPSMAEIGRYLDLSRERVRQILDEIVQEVRRVEATPLVEQYQEQWAVN